MVTTAKTSPSAAPAKAATAALAKPAAPAKTTSAKKATPKAAPKKVVKEAAKVGVKRVPAKKAVAKPKAAKPVKKKKPKLVRDSFTIPKAEYSVLDELKQRAGKLGSPVKKSELLRAGIKGLAAMADSAFVAALKAVPAVKTGRPSSK